MRALPPALPRAPSPVPSDTLSLHRDFSKTARSDPPEDPEASSDDSPDEERYLRPLTDAYQIVFDTLSSDLCPPPSTPDVPAADTITEAVLRKFEPTRLPSHAHKPSLPISRTVKSCLGALEQWNQKSSALQWSVPHSEAKQLEYTTAYRPPAPDQETGLDLSCTAKLDATADKAGISKPQPSHKCSLPLSMLENWEMRERKALGLTSQMDFLSASLMQTLVREPEACSEELRTLLIYLAHTCKNLAATSACNFAEMLRVRRSLLLESSVGFLLPQSKARLLTAPLVAPSLFGDRIPNVLSQDKEEQIHQMIATTAVQAKASTQPAAGFKRPSSKAPKHPPAKKAKVSTPTPSAAPAAPAPRPLASSLQRKKKNKRKRDKFFKGNARQAKP